MRSHDFRDEGCIDSNHERRQEFRELVVLALQRVERLTVLGRLRGFLAPVMGNGVAHLVREDARELASRIRGLSAADPRNPKQLCEGKTGDQRAAAHTGCKKDDFFGNDLHGNSCRSGDEGGGASSR